jgi:hypothetical protein
VGDLDVDLLGLHTEQLHLGHVRHAQQHGAHGFGVAAHLFRAVAVAAQGVDGPVNVAELVIEERSRRPLL